MNESREFHIGDILSVTTGRLISPRHMEGVYDILNYMTGDNLFTHQLPRAADECRPYLLKQHPDLASADVSLCTKDNYLVRLAGLALQYGETRPVQPIPLMAHKRIDPISEAKTMMGDKVVVVQSP